MAKNTEKLPNLKIAETEEELEKALAGLPSGKACVLYFYSSTCSPCVKTSSIIQQLAAKTPSVNFIKCNTDGCLDTAVDVYEVRFTPTILIIRDGKKVQAVNTTTEKGISDAIKKNQKNDTSDDTVKGSDSNAGPNSGSDGKKRKPYANTRTRIKLKRTCSYRRGRTRRRRCLRIGKTSRIRRAKKTVKTRRRRAGVSASRRSRSAARRKVKRRGACKRKRSSRSKSRSVSRSRSRSVSSCSRSSSGGSARSSSILSSDSVSSSRICRLSGCSRSRSSTRIREGRGDVAVSRSRSRSRSCVSGRGSRRGRGSRSGRRSRRGRGSGSRERSRSYTGFPSVKPTKITPVKGSVSVRKGYGSQWYNYVTQKRKKSLKDRYKK